MQTLRHSLFLALCFAPATATLAQLPAPENKPVVGARMPALSPDGSKLAFVWRGDIWVASSSGGRAYAVTTHAEYDAYPVFSPDGKWIAFQSNRTGSSDIWVVPTEGGTPKQLTIAGGRESLSDWSPDGKSLLFVSQRDTPHDSIFSLDLATLRFTKLTEDFKSINRPTYSSDGSRLAYERNGFPWTRPRYSGSGAAQLWTLDTKTGKNTPLADDGRQHLYPRFLPDGKSLVCVTYGNESPSVTLLGKVPTKLDDNPKRTPNLWVFPAEGGGKPKQLTQFVGSAVRFPTVARKSGDIAFEHGTDLYLLKAGAKEPQKISLLCGGDDKSNSEQRSVINSNEVTEAEISPDGKTFAFVLKEELWTIPVEKAKGRNADEATRLTTYPGTDHDINWSKDGKTLFFVSDRNGNERVFAMEVASKAIKPIWTGKSDAKSPTISPDGKLLGFWVAGKEEEGAGFYTSPTDLSSPPKRVLAIAGDSQNMFSWSPDMRWLAFTRRGRESGGTNLYIAKADGTNPINVTRLNAFHSEPTWSADGRYLYFSSNRDGGGGLWALPLTREEARTAELELKYIKPGEPVQVTIDFEDIHYRLRKLSGQNPDDDLQAVDSDGALYFLSGGNLFSASYDGKDTRQLTFTGGLGNLRLSAAGDTAYFSRGGQLFTLKPRVPGAQPSLVGFGASYIQNLRALRQAAFNQLWRSYNTRFYDPNFHGRDFAALKALYEPMLESVGTREEMANLGNLLLGELEASHSEVSPAPGSIIGSSSAQLGVYFDYSYIGPGIRIKDIPKRAPGSYEKTRLKPGEYILAVDNVDVTLSEDLYKVLNDKGERDFTLLVNDKPSREGARTVTYKAVSGGEWSDLHYRNRIESRSKLVEQQSEGKVGYVHISGMGGSNQQQFVREFYEWAEGKDAMIIDVRENGGGNIGDTLISWLGFKPYATNSPRGGYVVPAPILEGRQPWNKPIVVLMGDSSFSNAEMFPYGMRATGLAKLVGEPTPGYVIWTFGLGLVDGTGARMPFQGVWRTNGTSLENTGEKPDYLVPWSTPEYFAGKDPQLEKAISLLKK
ncbi:MAG: S41 family peptidase [Armatimonadetes bacterium]|nr:S41 family peptidase [Armatimonadota bacterium]